MTGNINSNISNGGFIAKARDCLIYSNFQDNNYLYRMNFDGSMKTRLSEVKCKYINIWEECAYYTDIYGVNIYRTHICNGDTDIIEGYDNYITNYNDYLLYDEVFGNINDLIIKDGRMFWTEYNGESIQGMDLNTFETYCYRDRISYSLNIEDGWAFYLKEGNKVDIDNNVILEFEMMYIYSSRSVLVDKAHYRRSLKKISFDIPDLIYQLTAAEEAVYYSSEDGIYRTTLRDCKTIKLSNSKSKKFILSGDYIYFINFNDNYRLYRLNTNNRTETKDSDVTDIRGINIIDDHIYYYIKTPENKLVLCRMGIDDKNFMYI